MGLLDLKLSIDPDTNNPRIDSSIESLADLRNKEAEILRKILEKGRRESPVILHSCRSIGGTKVPVKCCVLKLDQVPNAWSPEFVRREYTQIISETGASTVKPEAY